MARVETARINVDSTPFRKIERIVDELVERVELRDIQLADRDTHIAQVEDENARLADHAVRATRERNRAERRVAELELQADVERIKAKRPIWVGFDIGRRDDATAYVWPGLTRLP